MLKTILRILIVIAAGSACALSVNALRWDKNGNGTHNSLPLITPPREAPKAEDAAESELRHRVPPQPQDRGYQKVRVLENGWTLWKDAGLALNKGDQP